MRASGSERNSTASAPSPFVNSGGLPSDGFGASFTSTSSSSATPAPVRADTKQTGTRWPSRSAFSNGACSCPASIDSPCSRYFAIRSSSTSTTWSISAWCALATDEKSASPDGLKKQSTTRFPPSAGRLIGRHSLPKAARIDASTASQSTFSASMRLTMTMRQSLRSAACSIIRVVIISTPLAALTTTAAVSTASSAPTAWPMKSGKPGVSIRWMRAAGVSRCSTEARSECWNCFSSGSKSETVVPFSTLPGAPIAPAFASSASASVVLPAPPCPTSATVRKLSTAWFAMELLRSGW